MQQFTSRIIETLKTKEALFWAAILALYPMIKHTTAVYIKAFPGEKESLFDAWVYSIAVELAILLFVLRSGKLTTAQKEAMKNRPWLAIDTFDKKPIFYAFTSILVNFCYYFDVPRTVSAITICFILPVTIAFYSYEVIKEKDEPQRKRGPYNKTKDGQSEETEIKEKESAERLIEAIT